MAKNVSTVQYGSGLSTKARCVCIYKYILGFQSGNVIIFKKKLEKGNRCVNRLQYRRQYSVHGLIFYLRIVIRMKVPHFAACAFVEHRDVDAVCHLLKESSYRHVVYAIPVEYFIIFYSLSNILNKNCNFHTFTCITPLRRLFS